MAQHFSLAACDVVGFDLDHTLCRYNLPESARLIYNSFAQFLVKEKGYDKELLTLTPEDWDFCCKGLALDLEDGTFIKLAADGTVLRASHGTRMMTLEALAEAYGQKNWRHCVTDKHCAASNVDIPCCSGKCYFYDNYFDLPGALLCAKVVDSLTKQNRGQKTFDFWKDVVAGIQHNFKMSAFKENCGFFFPEIKRNLGKYVHRCPDSVRRWLQQLKAAGKITMLITSSHSDYCKLLGTYILGKDFADLFDIVITNALKPGFFSHFPSQRPFHTLENDEEQKELPSLDKPGWYSQGNAAHLYELLKKMTDKPKPKVVYFGDSMHSDIFPAHHYSNWETVLILEELQGQEMEKAEDAEPLEKRGKYEEPKVKPLNSLSNKWGSYFTDSVSRRGHAEDSLVYTWSSRRISAYSTIAIPSIEAITELPLDYKFTRFSTNNSKTAGYYPLVHYALGSQDTGSKIIFTEQ
ncbi:5'-nucleotidase domain-containing protein 1 isoform X1 [Peromyscus californicus insignis]|uniref:5'-nucleotidase domain-containing protein 1 isoform X1 n=2 Tax=Peromyscus californicus insignis TaxID=564181 RepID=UPI0022A7FD2D|nr:5'-nucleotidase domain-containing protein 1 isoform X1 [Peromyscus californicus insignis]